jgi:hypothetical protein
MMSKQINRTLIVAALGSLWLLGLLVIVSGASAKPQRPAVAPSAARNAAVVATTEAVLKETSELRELSIIRDVKSGALSRAEIQRMLVKNLNEDSTPEEMHSAEVFLKVLGLAPREFNYRPFLINLLTEQVAGYYDPKVQQFYLADWIELDGQKPVMAHELTHALQDQHFNLRRFEKWPKGDSDAELAAHALIEGDATLAMTLYLAKHPLVALAFMRSLSSTDVASEQIKLAPRALRDSLLFPYEQGSAWATQVYRRGGWKMVSDAFTRLPQSTEQILHVDKYFADEAPVKLKLPELKGTLGPTWRRLDTDVNGEWGLYLCVDEFLKNTDESQRATAGWAGDRFALYEGPKPGEAFFAQYTAWDTENDATEFFAAYAKRTEKRYFDAKVLTENASADRLEWQTSSGKVVLERRGKRVMILEGIPTNVKLETLVRAAWPAN